MKKFKKSLIFIVLLFIVISVSVHYKGQISKKDGAVETGVKTSAKTPIDDTLRFSVLGDVHGNAGKLDIAINDLYNINGNQDALILNGDNVDQGLKNQYNEIENILKKDNEVLPKTIIKNIGNHDYFDYERGQNKASDVEKFKNMYFDFSGEKAVYHDTWIKGYHFISLGSESGNTKELGAVNADLSQTQLKWLKEKLAEKHVNGKPVFVFLHQHMSTSIKGWAGVNQRSELNKILSAYPEAILFTSHTHVLLSIDNVKQNLPYTTVHTGAVSYGIIPEGYKIKRLYDESQGVYIEVKDNKVTVKGRDFAKKEWVFTKELSNGNKQ